jgi:ornithine carbamoyltransferase
MKVQSYPLKVWVLTPAFKPKEVELQSKYTNWSGQDYHNTAGTSKLYADSEIAVTQAEIIQVGKALLSEQQKAIDKRQAALAKRMKNITAAEEV